MSFKGITFAGQNVTPKNDGGLYAAHYGDGILWGCSMAISGDDLVIQSGEFIAGGRVCWVDGATNVDLSSRSLSNGYIQVIMDFDMSQPEGSQWYIHMPLVESATTTFPALTKGDINDTATLYQVELAVVQVSGGNLTSIYSSIGTSRLCAFVPNGTRRVLAGGTDTYGSLDFIDNDTSLIGGLYGSTTTKNITFYSNGGTMYIRPNGVSSSTGQFYIDTSGNITTKAVSITFDDGAIVMGSGNTVVANDNGTIALRPNGSGSSVGQFYIDTSGLIHSVSTYNNTTSASTNMIINSAGVMYRSTSLRKYKKDIKPITEEDAEKGYELNPVSFKSAIEGDTRNEMYGFIAEEVEEVLPDLATYDEDGKLNGVAYDRVCAILLKQNQMLKERIDELEKRVEALEK